MTPLPLVGTVWSWSPESGDPDPARRYTLELMADGTARIQADCNRGKARYDHQDDVLRLGGVATTKRACPPGSRGDAFVKRLASVDGYRYEGIDLLLTSAGAVALRLVPG